MDTRRFKLSDTEIRALEAAERETHDAAELRRLQGVRLYGNGVAMEVIQQVTGAARRTVDDWRMAYQRQGIGGLKSKGQQGNHRGLSVAQRAEACERLQSMSVEQALGNALEAGHSAFWSIETVAAAIERWYGVVYRSRQSYRQLLLEAGFSFQQPETIYRSRPADALVADFEAEAEKKSRTSNKSIPKGSSWRWTK